MTVADRAEIALGDWSEDEQALHDVLAAVERLDAAGFGGPYVLALSPTRYNALFRRYQGSNMLQLDHLTRLCAGGVLKAPIQGGVLLDPRVGTLRIGQDMQVGFSATDGIHLRLFVAESLGLMLDEPQAVCTLGDSGWAEPPWARRRSGTAELKCGAHPQPGRQRNGRDQNRCRFRA
jgi:uncharacterized linocin/CFP29 family protein